MFPLEILVLGLALAIDAGIVCFAFGILALDKTKAQRTSYWLATALTFGLFQFFMLWLGSYAGYLFSFSAYGHFFQIVVAGIFFLMGMKVLKDSMEAEEDEEEEMKIGFVPLFILGLATSIDALAAGISLGTLPKSYESAFVVGLITFVVCSLFYFLSQFLKNIPDKWLLRITSVIFFSLGGRIIWDFAAKGLL